MEFEVADVLNDHVHKLVINPHQSKIVHRVRHCRTAYLGIHKESCDNPECKNVEYAYDSCRNGHCPKCGHSKQLTWENARNQEILPVDYSNVVYKIPSYLKPLFKYNQEGCYNTFFKSVNETFKFLTGKGTKENNPQTGFIAMLHTWTQLLDYHIHMHCLVPEVLYNKAKNRWENINNQILTKEILNRTFKRILAKNIIAWMNKQNFLFTDVSAEYILEQSKNSRNYVYVKRSIKDVTSVIKYLGTYCNKIAITNDRIKNYDGKIVTISYVDRADGNKIKEEEIEAVEFIRRFCLHILPHKFMKIRYYGFMSNSCKKKRLKSCNEGLKKLGKKISIIDKKAINKGIEILKYIEKLRECTVCHKGKMVAVYSNSTRYGPKK